MPRAYTREPTRPDAESEQTHDDCEWLNEEDRKEDVLRHWRHGYRRRRAPSVTQNERRNVGGQNNPDAEHRRGDGGHKRGIGLVGTLALCGRATAIGLDLRENAPCSGVARIALVHGAFGPVSAAGHARFRGRHPPGADRRVPGHQTECERESRETVDERHDVSRMLDGRDPVKPV
jgi:hypothetical protein